METRIKRRMKCFPIFAVALFLSITLCAQNDPDYGNYPTEYDYNKKGTLIVEPIHHFGALSKLFPADSKIFKQNINEFINSLIRLSPVLSEKKGFDLGVSENAFSNTGSEDVLRLKNFEYGFQCELCFSFELFFKKGGKWSAYNPQWLLAVNTPHYNMYMPYQGIINDVFLGYPNITHIAPGVDFHYNNNHEGILVVFNPKLPPYWLPVTVREIVNVKLKYFAEKEKSFYSTFKSLADALSESQLDSPAYFGGPEADGLLGVNGRGEGSPLLRFNPGYWDRSLPRSAIQYFTLNYAQQTERKEKENWRNERLHFYKNNGRINYKTEVPNSIAAQQLAHLIQK